MRLSLIVAADEQDTIGRDGALPWYLPEDLKRFKQLTTGHVVIAGRLTHDSIVARLGRPLPGRSTLVVTRRPARGPAPGPAPGSAPGVAPGIDGVEYVPDVASAIERALVLAGDDEVFVIGGAQIYEATLPLVQTVHLTRVRGSFAGDTALPGGWLTPYELTAREDHDAFAFETYQRRSYYYLENSRGEAQSDDMRRLEAEGRCLFCPGQEALTEIHRTPQWTVVPNRFPYRGTGLHLLLIPDEHVTDMADLSPAAQADFWRALAWVRERYSLTYYGIAIRNGDPRFTGGTIRHLHVHLVVGDVDNPEVDFVRVRLSSRPPT